MATTAIAHPLDPLTGEEIERDDVAERLEALQSQAALLHAAVLCLHLNARAGAVKLTKQPDQARHKLARRQLSRSMSRRR